MRSDTLISICDDSVCVAHPEQVKCYLGKCEISFVQQLSEQHFQLELKCY